MGGGLANIIKPAIEKVKPIVGSDYTIGGVLRNVYRKERAKKKELKNALDGLNKDNQPKPMPSRNDASILEQEQKRLRQLKQRSGASSTILSGEKFGG